MNRPSIEYTESLRKTLSSSGGDLEQFFDVFFGAHRPPLMHSEIGWHPAADMYETETHYVIVVEIAGILVKNLSLVLEQNSLVLRGVRQEPETDEKRQYHKMEIPYGPFERIFTLHSPVNCETVHADYKNGFLAIRLEKRATPMRKRTTITIR